MAEKKDLDNKILSSNKTDQLGDPAISVSTVNQTMNHFLKTADVQKSFGEPFEKNDITIIPAAEVMTLMGFGSGYGSDNSTGGGGGGGGGGKSFSRPVAVVIASSNNVRVEPVVDVTKIALAFFTALGFIFTTLAKMKTGKMD